MRIRSDLKKADSKKSTEVNDAAKPAAKELDENQLSSVTGGTGSGFSPYFFSGMKKAP